MKSTIKILFDELGQQVMAHENQGDRLTGFYSIIDRQGWRREVGTITAANLAGVNVLVLTNRMNECYSTHEIRAIVNFVHDGGGLWCMSNHGAFNGTSVSNQLNNHVRFDSAIATTFFTDFKSAAYQSTDPNEVFVTLEGDNLKDHPILNGGPPSWPSLRPDGNREIHKVVTRSFCGIYANSLSTTLVGLGDLGHVKNTQTGKGVGSKVVWAVALDDENVTGQGRVVICADAGWLGDVESNIPGPGAFQKPYNPQFALNTLSWLSKLGLA